MTKMDGDLKGMESFPLVFSLECTSKRSSPDSKKPLRSNLVMRMLLEMNGKSRMISKRIRLRFGRCILTSLDQTL